MLQQGHNEGAGGKNDYVIANRLIILILEARYSITSCRSDLTLTGLPATDLSSYASEERALPAPGDGGV